MPPSPRTPDIFMIPSVPNLSAASIMIAALVILDVSTEIGEYHGAIKRSVKWGSDPRIRRRVCKAINVAALQVAVVGMILIILSALAVMHLTKGMDGRMTLVLEGISRLEAAHLMAYISVKTPKWIGVYHSPEKESCIKHVGEGIDALKFHVRYSISQYFLLVYCLMLPFAGRPISALLGFAIGFLIELLILFAREGGAERRFRVASIASMVFALLSSIMFADGCHYIQIIWGSGLLFSEWGLGMATFSAAFAAVLCSHFFHLQQTVWKFCKDRQISKHDERETMAITLINSHMFGSLRGSLGQFSESQRIMFEEEEETKQSKNELERMSEEEEETKQSQSAGENDDEETKATTAQSTTTWSLLKKRLFAPTDLVIFSRFEYYIGVVVSIASIFVVIVNIGATKQMNMVRKHYHNVHHALYGQMDQGPVCAFDEIGGTVSTFENEDAALSTGYTLAHCGACGQCSTWQDLRLQYTTRSFLAKEAARCARKSLVYGRDAVHDCLMEEAIGFSDRCAECWTEDIMCARSNCAFIFLQSNMINTVSNFQVGEDTITAATCEEAMCELVFVPCSGANRRRMNITSSIARSGTQLCGIVDVGWEDVFGENGSYKVIGAHVESRNDEL